MDLPPLNPLRVFEVVARTGSLTSAAQELHVSQSAVSRQIAVLQDYLGVRLFRRETVGIRLTDIGEAYARKIGPALRDISAATKLVTHKYADNVIRLRTYTTLTARWLIPRLPRFQALHPDIEIAISEAKGRLDYGDEQFDIAIVFGDGKWPDAEASLLLDDIIEPVCSPQLALDSMKNGLEQTLLAHPLLVSRYRKDDWPLWLEHAGLPGLFARAKTIVFGNSVLTREAAIDGLGIAMGQLRMQEFDLQSGRLVQPFALPFETRQGPLRGHSAASSPLRQDRIVQDLAPARGPVQAPAMSSATS